MKVDVGEGSRAAGAVADERQIHQGYTVNDTEVEVGRSGQNRAVAVAQQHQAGGASGSIGSVDGGTAAAGGVLGVGLPVRNGVLPGVRDGGAAVVTLHQHPGGNSVERHAFVGSDEYHQVGDLILLLLFFAVLLLLFVWKPLLAVCGIS